MLHTEGNRRIMLVSLFQVGYGDDECPAARTARIVEQLERAAHADLIVLPELWVQGAFAYDIWDAEPDFPQSPTIRTLAEVAKRRNFWLHCGTFIEAASDDERGPEGRGLWNTAVLVSPEGEVRLTYRKIHRFGFGAGEAQLIEAGNQLAVTEVVSRRVAIPVGLATCYDLRFPEMFRSLGQAGVELVIVAAAWPEARVEHWKLLGRARAVENQMWVLQCNTSGDHRGLTMAGHSQVIAPTGEVVGELGAEAGVLSVEIDIGLVGKTREDFPVLRDRRAIAWVPY